MTDRPKASLDLRAPHTIVWRGDAPSGVILSRVHLGADPYGAGMQIAVASASSTPTRPLLRELWELRGGKKGVDVAVAVVRGDRVTVFGPDPEARPIEGLPLGQAERLLQSVLDEPSAIAAWDRFGDLRRAISTTGVAGFTNSGLFASHHLNRNVPSRADWPDASSRAAGLLPLRGKALIAGLGFTVQEQGGVLLLTGAGSAPRAVAVLLDEGETFDGTSAKHQLSPVAFGLREASDHQVDWLVAVKEGRLRLYPGRTGVGVGQKGQTETYFEIDLASVDEEHAALLPLVFSAEALEPQGSTQQILEGSAKYATELGTRLRDRIYKDVVPPLAQAVAGRLPQMGLQVDEEGLRTAYRVSLRILFRLLFQAYAEDRGLLPAGRNERYDANSLQTAARRDLDTDAAAFGSAATLWADLEQVWEAVDQGNEQWMVPAYDGGLFARAAEKSAEGALIALLRLPDSVMGPVLQALLVDVNEDGVRGPVDFQSLSVREFGTIYEGLLESSLSLAESDLTLDATGAWVPVGAADEVLVPAGSAYFHNSSGERKATGSYFTPAIVVDHLIERSIVPVLGRHLEGIAALLAEGKQVEAGRAFFDFRVADLAMGSGHFLVAAIDKVEALYRDFLTRHDVPRVTEELVRIEQTAKKALGRDAAAILQVDNVGLLRRQVARRCIYGIDVNPLALELSRLALWIHTFVPGLPMSSFDHNLVCANSLTGIGTVEEALAALEPGRSAGQVSLVAHVVTDALEAAAPLLRDAANADEADKAGVERGTTLRTAARDQLEPIRRIFDLAVAIRTGEAKPIMAVDLDELDAAASTPAIRTATEHLNPAHMPYLFPEVFQRENPGFDVLLGNPPWEKVHVEEHQWWGLKIPGLRSLRPDDRREVIEGVVVDHPEWLSEYQREIERLDAYRAVIATGPFPGIGSGHIDLYQVFAWRYWQLLANFGKSGLVLPRGAFSGSGLEAWRRSVFGQGAFADIAFLLNTRNWVFEGVDNRKTIGLAIIERAGKQVTRFSGPFNSMGTFLNARTEHVTVTGSALSSWSSTAAFPLVPDTESGRVMATMYESPRFFDADDQWDFRPVQGDMNATGDKSLIRARSESHDVPVLAGASFNLWSPDFGSPTGWADANELGKFLRKKRTASVKNTRSSYFGLPAAVDALPYQYSRIAFRDQTNQENSRTTIVCLVPPGTAAVHTAPLLVQRAGHAANAAFALGVMSSRPFDWVSRRWIDRHLTFELLKPLPRPRQSSGAASDRVVEIAGRLAAVDERYQVWADEVGVPVGSVTDPFEKQDLIDELDALVSLLYGLGADQVEHIYATFHRGWDHAPRLAAVLEHFHGWEDRA